MQQKLSMKDRKEEILKAYGELQGKYKEKEQLAKTVENEAKVQKAAEEEIMKK